MNICLLGTGAAVANGKRDNTYLLIKGQKKSALIDCGGSPISKLTKVGCHPNTLQSILITHTHIDHWYGLLSLLHGMWLLRRKEPLTIYCPEGESPLFQKFLHSPEITKWSSSFPIQYSSLALERQKISWDLEIQCEVVPVEHAGCPTIGVSLTAPDGKKIIYSSDTRPTERLRELAFGADILIHESQFPDRLRDLAVKSGHSTGLEAAHFAKSCQVKKLVLIHIETMMDFHETEILGEARGIFENTIIPDDLTWL